MSATQTLIDTLQTQRTTLLHTLTQFTDTQLTTPNTIGKWSIKNIIAHLTIWEETSLAQLKERLTTGTTPSYISDILAHHDNWNETQVAARDHLSFSATLTQWHQARQAVINYIQQLGDTQLQHIYTWDTWGETWDDSLSDYILQTFAGHEQEHATDINTLTTQTAQ